MKQFIYIVLAFTIGFLSGSFIGYSNTERVENDSIVVRDTIIDGKHFTSTVNYDGIRKAVISQCEYNDSIKNDK